MRQRISSFSSGGKESKTGAVSKLRTPLKPMSRIAFMKAGQFVELVLSLVFVKVKGT